jgi:Dyp-type peroxidase family
MFMFRSDTNFPRPRTQNFDPMIIDQTLLGAQRGLLMRAVFGQVITVYLSRKDENTKKAVIGVIRDLAKNVNSKHPDCGLVAAFAPALWSLWNKRPIPIQTSVLNNGVKFANTGGDLLLYVKALDHETAAELVASVHTRLAALSSKIETIIVGKRPDARIISGRYLDSITNPNDPVSLSEDILIGGDTPYRGACFALTQKFLFDWISLASQSPDTQDAMLGRNPDGTVLSQHATYAHIHRARITDSNGDQRKLLRQALPFGESAGHAGREEGIMFVAFCNEQDRFEKILKNLLGDQAARPDDRLMQIVQGVGGTYWYVPAASELGVPAVSGPDDVYEDPHWKVSSTNGYLFYNSQDYLHQMAEGRYIGGDPPSSRLLSLMSRTFSHWRDSWVSRQFFPRLPHLETLLTSVESKNNMIASPVPVRKGLANGKTLAELLSSPNSSIARGNGLLRIEPREYIVGVIPDFTLGRGKEVVPYLNNDETLAAWLKGELNEWSAMGHVVPNYETLVTKGLGALIADSENRLESAIKSHKDDDTVAFYRSTVLSLRGVQGYLRNWATIAKKTSTQTTEPLYAENMHDVSNRLTRLAEKPPRSFHDAVQLIFSFHCCLHLVGELTSLGRLDQILWPFLKEDKISPDLAQDIIDCLFIKIGENAFVNRAFVYDYVTYGTTAVCGLGGNFPQGGGINQWVQQITVGGYKATDGDMPEGGANPLTMIFLKSARRIPVNAPTLSLRVYKDMPEEYLDEAAKGILSGGAQPILYNDDKLCEALFRSGDSVSRSWSRNYAADGCYEPMLAGASEFSFNNVAPLLALEQTINQGATYGSAGPEYLRGLKQTFRSPPARDIKSFEQLQAIFLEQLEWLIVQCYNTLLGGYGNLSGICPSPLLSVLIDGCVENGRDLTNGGAKFHILAALCVGVSNTIDSLFAIKKLVYDPKTALTTLPELVECLTNDWGYNMIEPFQSRLLGPADAAEHGLRFQELRKAALVLPKWGSGNEEVNLLGDWLVSNMVRLCVETIRTPSPALKPALDGIIQKYGSSFEFMVCPGIGTFEGYVGDGVPCGASADGRRNGMPIASDLSPVPAAQDLPPSPAFRNIYQAMKSYKTESVEYGLSNASPVDMNIKESFPLKDLQRFLRAYARGDVGGNLITLTCADLATYEAAVEDPEKYNLVRVRMGGWTEFYATMLPSHQDQHQRRQYFTP